MTVSRDQTYDSNFEADYAAEPDLKKARWAHQVPWERQMNIRPHGVGEGRMHYIIDFKVHQNDGSVEYIECKREVDGQGAY